MHSGRSAPCFAGMNLNPRILIRIIALLLLAIPFRGLPVRAQQPVDPAFAALLQQKLDSCRNVYNVPGISATLLLPGNRFWNGATGRADIYTNQPMDTAFVFQAASTTKLFTATLIFQLIEEGLLNLDDTIGDFLAPIPNIAGGTRIRYLLNHRSGLADFLQTPGAANNWFATPDAIWSPVQVLNTYGAPPLFAQGAAFSYSNTNYVLLGIIVEAVTGHPFHQELWTRIVQPLGLEEIYFPSAVPVLGDLVPGWSSWSATGVYDTDVTPVLRDCFSSFGFSAGAIVVRPWELARFTRAVMGGAMLGPASLTTMRTCTNVNFGDGANGYGHGTMRYAYGGRTYFGHSGDINGFTQMSVHSVMDSITITLSINRNNAPRGPIAAAMLATAHQGLSVGVPDAIAAPSSFTVHPVPATDRVTLCADDLGNVERIELCDATGRLVLAARPNGSAEQVLMLNGLASGLYHVRLIDARQVRTQALLKE